MCAPVRRAGASSLARLGPPLLALLAALALGVALIVAARSVNRPPVVDDVRIEPRSIRPGQTASVFVRAHDPDGEAVSYRFVAEAGRVEVSDPKRPYEARYTPSATGGSSDRIQVVVTDARGVASQYTTVFVVARDAAPAVATPNMSEDATPPPGPPPPISTPPPLTTIARVAPAATPPPAPLRVAPNRAPTLEGGQLIAEAADSTVGLEARGGDPDGDLVIPSWDFGGCLDSESSDTSHADVRLKEGCDTGTAILTWTDARGESTSTLWTITR
jgi:hypothetical protein